MRSVFGWVGQVVAWLVIVGAVVVLAAGVVVPRLAGATPYTVLTGSMRPHYPPGTLVVVKPTDTDKLQSGDVATYQLKSGDPTVATHRIAAVGITLDGEKTFTFKGDANNAPDPAVVKPVQIRGKLWYAVPYLGYLNNALTGHEHQLAVWIAASLLIGYAAYMFVGSLLDRRRRRRPGGKTASVATPARSTTRPTPVPVAEATPLLVVGSGFVTLLLASGLIRVAQRRSLTRAHA